jgi:hypothetical protein
MFTPSTLQQWLADQAVPLCFLSFALLMGIFLLYLSAISRRSALARRRAGRTETSFVEELAAYGYDPEIAGLTYRTLRDRLGITFPLEPTDDLDRDLGLDSADQQAILEELLTAAGRDYAPGILAAPITSVAHLVRHVQTSPVRPPDRFQPRSTAGRDPHSADRFQNRHTA